MLVVFNHRPKIRKPNLVTYLNHAPIFERNSCGFKNRHKKDICLKFWNVC